MAWTSPMTAVTGEGFTAAQWNTHVRDNLLETFPAKATAGGQYFLTSGAHSVTTRSTQTAVVSAAETTTAGSYGDLSTGGPAVTVATGTRALVYISAAITPGDAAAYLSYAVSGATTIAASDAWGVYVDGVTSGNEQTLGAMHLVNLTSGSNTFTLKYRSASGSTSRFANRRITVIPF